MARQLTGQLLWRRLDGKWDYTLAEAAREEARFETMDTHIRQRHNMVSQYIVTRSLLELCEVTERNQGAQAGMRWWKNAGIDLAGARETTKATSEAGEDGMKY